jgi:hypothetical protein
MEDDCTFEQQSLAMQLRLTHASRASQNPLGSELVILRATQWLFVFLALLLLLHPRAAIAQQESFDRERYYRAVKYCRQSALLGLVTIRPSTMTLSPDKQILCFDGKIVPNIRVSLMEDLEDGGLFVVRSLGGRTSEAIVLANLIRDRHASLGTIPKAVMPLIRFALS